MRILIKLEALKDCTYDLKYYNKLQGFIYDLLRGTEYTHLHDVRGYKFFSFSNIFPANGTLEKGFKEGEPANFLIASPNEKFIETLYKKFERLRNSQKNIGIGDYFFKIREIKSLRPKIKRSCILQTGTPLIMRIPKDRFPEYGIKSDREYIDWNTNVDFNAFLNQVEANIFKKYNKYHNTEVGQFPLFEQFKFKKPVVSHVVLNGREVKFIGTTWEFIFNYITDEKQKILEFGMESGFGELNSLGFGFVNLVR